MSRESAVTESLSYHVENCHICGSEVGLGEEIPDDEMVYQGVAVIIGEGTISTSKEDAGNWDVSVEFSGEKSDSSPPSISGYILCTDCAESIHGYSVENGIYRNKLPNDLASGNVGPGLSDAGVAVLIIIGIAFVVFLLLLL